MFWLAVVEMVAVYVNSISLGILFIQGAVCCTYPLYNFVTGCTAVGSFWHGLCCWRLEIAKVFNSMIRRNMVLCFNQRTGAGTQSYARIARQRWMDRGEYEVLSPFHFCARISTLECISTEIRSAVWDENIWKFRWEEHMVVTALHFVLRGILHIAHSSGSAINIYRV